MRALAVVIVVVSDALAVAATVVAWLSLGTATGAGLSLGTKAVEVSLLIGAPTLVATGALIATRHFRSRYDAARTVELFSLRLRSEIDIESLRGELVRVVRETVHPAGASLWLRDAVR